MKMTKEQMDRVNKWWKENKNTDIGKRITQVTERMNTFQRHVAGDLISATSEA